MNHANSNQSLNKNISSHDDLTQEEILYILESTKKDTINNISQSTTDQNRRVALGSVQSNPMISSETNNESTKTKKKTCGMDGCRKKLTILSDYECKCGKCFCDTHRFISDHHCQYDYKKEHMKLIEKRCPKIEHEKFERI